MNPKLNYIDPTVNLTRTTLERSISKGQELLATRAEKLNESQSLMDAASELHKAAHRLEELHNDRNRSVLDQLEYANETLEGAFVRLNDYVVANTSSTANGVKRLVEMAMPLLPVAAYLLYEHLRIEEVQEPEADEESEEDTYEDILFAIE